MLAVSDEPAVVSTTGGVRFSAVATGAEVAALPALAAEVDRREGGVPVLRLPWPVEGVPPEGFATEVVLPLRPGVRADVASALAGLPAELLLALRGLDTVEIAVDGAVRTLAVERSDGRARITDGGTATDWQVAERSGELAAELVADRPVEERARRGWTVTWAVPLDGDGVPVPLPAGQVVHAPTPSDEPLSLPVRLIAPFPLGPDRRHVAPGAVTDALVAAAADTFADLVAALPPVPALLRLVPRIGLAGAALDAAINRAVLDRLASTAWLPVAGEPDLRQAPDRAAALDDATDERVAALSGVLPGLLPADWSRRTDGPALSALGIRRIGIAEAVEAVRGVDRPASWWAGLYAALDGADREELAALPVPLADGRTAHGPAGRAAARRGPAGRPAGAAGSAAGRARRGGAAGRPAAARAARAPGRPRRRSCWPTPPSARRSRRRWTSVDDALHGAPHPDELAAAVLALVAAARPAVGELPWLGELALPDADGGWAPAGELVLPGSPLAAVLEPGALGVLDPATAATADPDALRAVGVLDTFALVRAEDPDELDVDDADRWADAVHDRLPARRPAAGVAAADRRPGPGARPRLGPRAAAAGAAAGRGARGRRPRRGRRCPATCAGGCGPIPCSGACAPTGSGTRTARSYRDCTNRRPPRRTCWNCCARRGPSTTCWPTWTTRWSCSTASATPPARCAPTCSGRSTRAWPPRWTGSTWTRRSGSGSPRTGSPRTPSSSMRRIYSHWSMRPSCPAGERPARWPTCSTCPWPSELVRGHGDRRRPAPSVGGAAGRGAGGRPPRRATS